MINNQKVIAIIPARSGSKGLKDKNIRLLDGKPLMAYTILAAQEANVFDEIFVSTDSSRYADIAREYGVKVPFLRDNSLATDTASSWDVVKDAIEKYRTLGCTFDIVVLLQPTSPLRTAEDINDAFKVFQSKNASTVISVCEVDHSPLWSNTLPWDHSLVNFINHNTNGKPRQLLEKYYRINGALYIINIPFLIHTNDIYKENCFAYIMPKSRSIDIDDEVDFLFAKALLTH